MTSYPKVSLAVVALALAPGAAFSQLEDVLGALLGGGREGRLESVEKLREDSTSATFAVEYRRVRDPAALRLSARLLDARLRTLDGFTVAAPPLAGADGTAELTLTYTGAGHVLSAAVEVRLEKADGAAAARKLVRLVRDWPRGSAGEAVGALEGALGGGDAAPALVGDETDESGGAEAAAPGTAAEILLAPVPLGDTPTAETDGGGATPPPGGGGGTAPPGGGGVRPGVADPVLGRADRGRRLRLPTDLVLGALVPARALGYAWASNPAAASYDADAGYSYNSAGGAIRISRRGAGDYAVLFAGLTGEGGGNVQVTAYGGGGQRCQVSGWGAGGGGFTASVRCTDAAGAPADSAFTVLATFTLESGGRLGYVWANDPAAPRYTPDAGYARGPGSIEIQRGGLGTYQLRFAQLGGGGQQGGNVQVTAYGSGGEACKVGGWSSGGDDFEATVRCFAPGGRAADARFAALVVSLLESPGAVAYAWADQPQADSYTPALGYAYNAGGGGARVARSGAGRYALSFPGLGGGAGGGTVQVTAYGPGSETCAVAGWNAAAADFAAQVRCFDAAGAPADSRFAVLVVR